MRSSYRIVGDFIKQSKLKNDDGRIDRLLGVNLDKKLMPSVANLNGVDLTKYKVIKKGQFGCKLMSVGRDKKVPISRLTSYGEALISSAYFVFEVIDENELNPEYLMMWFSRSESDRFQWFQSGADIRGRITWEEFCSLPIKVPSIVKQREIVKECNTIVNRIKLNEQHSQKLEETAQALYKHWFVDFEFPNVNGQPYKSSGGKMIYNDELDQEIPVGWNFDYLNNICENLNKKRKPISGIEREDIQGVYPYYGAMGVVDYIDKYIFEGTYLLVSEDGVHVTDKNGNPSLQYVWGKFWVNNHAHILQGNHLISTEYLMLALKNTNVSHLVTGAAQPKINLGNLSSIQLHIPNDRVLDLFNRGVSKLYQNYKLISDENNLLKEAKELLLSKMTKIESLKTDQVL